MIGVAEKVIREAGSLPSLSSALTELAQLLKDDRVGTADFERVVRNDPALTAGLLHDIGKLVAGTRLDEVSGTVIEEVNEYGQSSVEAEIKTLGTDHTEVGALLCKTWQLPSSLEWAARWHHFRQNLLKT